MGLFQERRGMQEAGETGEGAAGWAGDGSAGRRERAEGERSGHRGRERGPRALGPALGRERRGVEGESAPSCVP